MIALSWPAGAGADGTATFVNITSWGLDVPNATSALQRIKLKSKLKCFFFTHLNIIGREQIRCLNSSHIILLCAYFGF